MSRAPRNRLPAHPARRREDHGPGRLEYRPAQASEHPEFELASRRVAARQPAVDDQRGAVDVAGLVRREEQGSLRDLFGLAAAPERIELAQTLFLAARACELVDRLGHAGLDEPGTDRVDPNPRAR